MLPNSKARDDIVWNEAIHRNSETVIGLFQIYRNHKRSRKFRYVR